MPAGVVVGFHEATPTRAGPGKAHDPAETEDVVIDVALTDGTIPAFVVLDPPALLWQECRTGLDMSLRTGTSSAATIGSAETDDAARALRQRRHPRRIRGDI